MKKFLALIIALLMAASVVPAFAVSAEDVSVTYTVGTVNAKNLKVGDTFDITLSISANSRLFSGHWYVDYPEQYVEPVAVSTNYEGSLLYNIQQAEFNGTNNSDEPAFLYRLVYEGGVGGSFGEQGNKYTDIGMYLNSFDYGNGVMMGGQLAKITYRIIKRPTTSACEHDSTGYYLPVPVLVRESTYWVPGTQIAPDVEYFRDHETVNTVSGKVYMSTGSATTYPVTFYDFNGQVVTVLYATYGSSVTAPSVPAVINNSNGTYMFFGWDAALTYITGATEVHAEYVLRGDTDLNGVITANDALLAMRSIMNLQTITEKQAFAAEVDNASGLTANDALKIMRYVMNLIGTLA